MSRRITLSVIAASLLAICAAPGATLGHMMWVNLKAQLGAPADRQGLVVLQGNRHFVLEQFQTRWILENARQRRDGQHRGGRIGNDMHIGRLQVEVVVAVVVAVLAMAQDQPQVVLLPNEHDSLARFAEV